jgi:hypothetical protein
MAPVSRSRFYGHWDRRCPVQVGLLWYDDSAVDIATKVQDAAERYEEKYGRQPNYCYVNPTTLPEGGVPANRIKVVASPAVLPNHFWVGIHRDKHRSERR